MNTQPEALRLADALEPTWTLQSDKMKAAAELRRLHEVNQMLVDALKWIGKRCPIEHMHEPVHILHLEAAHDAGACARAALAKVKDQRTGPQAETIQTLRQALAQGVKQEFKLYDEEGRN